MSLVTQIAKRALELRKAKDPQASVLTTLKGEIETKEKTFKPARAMTDDEVIAVIKANLKKVAENIEIYSDRGIADKLAAAEAEKELLECFLPRQMTEVELTEFANAKIKDGANMGQVMAALKAEKAGLYDGKLASQIVKDLLK